MTSTLTRIALPLLLALAAGTAAAHGDVKCTTKPKSEWKSLGDLAEKVNKEGWVIRRRKSRACIRCSTAMSPRWC